MGRTREPRRKTGQKHHDGGRHGRWDDGPLVQMASVDAVLDAIEQVDLERPWLKVAPHIFPMLPRRRPLPMETDPPLRQSYPPGIEVGFGIDIGPAMLHVGASQIERWSVSEADVATTAITNVRQRSTSRRQFGLIQERIQGVPVSVFQSREGWASALILLPDELCRIMGERPSLLLAPMRDVLLRLPIDTDMELARWMLEEFVALDPNGLAVPVLAQVDGVLRFAAAPAPGAVA
jgi:hypothetical protein